MNALGTGTGDKENPGHPEQQNAAAEAPAAPSCVWQPARGARPPTVDVRHTPLGSGTEWACPPVSCPSRLQHSSPARHSSSFDPFAGAHDEPTGATPLCAPPAGRPAAPPAVHRKPVSGGSPPPALAPLAIAATGRIHSCPPERVGRRARPVVRLRVKRSLNGAVAAAGGPHPSRDAAAGPPLPQLAGCSRKRFEADLVSPPMSRKSSRTLLDEQQASEMMARLALAPRQPGSSGGWAHGGPQARRQPGATRLPAATPMD